MPVSHKHRSAGEGSIYTTADGRLRGALILPHPVTGKATRRFVTGRSRAEVVRKFDELRKAGGFDSRDTVGDYLNRWLESQRHSVRPSTWRQREMYVRLYMVPAFGAVPLHKLAPLDVERMTSGLVASGRSPRTAAHARTILRGALADAERDGLVSRNVARLARPPKVEADEMRTLTPGEVRQLLDATADHRYGPLFAFAVGSGLRLGEILGLRWQDVEFNKGEITVRGAMRRAADGGWEIGPTKTRRSRRTLILPETALSALRRQRARQAAVRLEAGQAWQDQVGLVFTDIVGRPLRGFTVSAAFHEVAASLRLPVRFHDLRHTFATISLAAGVPLKVVSDLLGHSTITLTADVYAHVVPQARREAADAFNRAIAGDQ